MSVAQRPRLALEPLCARIVPTVLDLTTIGSEVVAPSGAILSQYDSPPPEAGTSNGFVRLSGPGGGPKSGVEHGYNTDARPIEFDAVKSANHNHAITLAEVPVVSVGGVNYREFLLNVNQTIGAPNVSLDEMRIYLGSTGTLTGYNTATNKLSGQSAVFDLDAGGDVSVLVNANLNLGVAAPDAVLLIPDSAFAGANGSTSVYLYSKFGGTNGGFEEWAVADVPLSPPPPPPPPPSLGSLSGRVFRDLDSDGTYDDGEGLGGLTITLSGFDSMDNLFPGGDPTFVTEGDGTYHFDDLAAGTYFIMVTEQTPYTSDAAILGTTTDVITYGGDGGSNQFSNIDLSAGETGVDFDFRMFDNEP